MKSCFVLLLMFACVSVGLGQLSGPLSGTLASGTYHVVDTISVNSSDSLRLLPGTTFIFDGPYPFWIWGSLLAEGTESDSIVFTTDTLTNPTRWRGLRFVYSNSSGSRLAYACIENGCAIGIGDNSFGGALYFAYSSPQVAHCMIRNSTATYGGGIYCFNCSPSLAGCTVTEDTARYGGGVYCYYLASPVFTNCLLSRNWAGTSGGALNCDHAGPVFVNCTFTGNAAGTSGGAVRCFSNPAPSFANCLLTGNSSPYGGATYFYSDSAFFANCILSDNRADHGGGGAYCDFGSTPTFTHSTFTGNWVGSVVCEHASPTFKSSIIAFSVGPGIRFVSSHESEIEFCDFFANSGGNFSFYNNDPTQGPPRIGARDSLNANHDSCDVYRNIFLDPLFADTASGDFHLTDYSPCLGASDSASSPPTDFEGQVRPDPPGRPSDIGADEHWLAAPVGRLVISVLSGYPVLCWPPFGGASGGYCIYRSFSPDGPETLMTTVWGTTTWTDSLTPYWPPLYLYRVTAVGP